VLELAGDLARGRLARPDPSLQRAAVRRFGQLALLLLAQRF
jgi:hypothetical protein